MFPARVRNMILSSRESRPIKGSKTKFFATRYAELRRKLETWQLHRRINQAIWVVVN